MEPPRRSGRKRTQNRKYFNDNIASLEEDSDLISNAEQHSKASSPRTASEHESDTYAPDETTAHPDTEAEEGGSITPSEDAAFENTPGASNAYAADPANDDSSVASSSDSGTKKRPARSRKLSASRGVHKRASSTPIDSDDEPQARHVRPPRHSTRVVDTFGPDAQVTQAFQATKAKWSAVRATPYRTPNIKGIGGFARSFFQSEVERKRATTQAWAWYFNGGAAAMRQHESVRALSSDEAAPYLSERADAPRHVLWGPFDRLAIFDVPPQRWINLPGAWKEAVQQADGVANTISAAEVLREGWCINVGTGDAVHAAEWVPGREEGPQYLALAMWPRDAAERTSAFLPSGGMCATIQIWEVASRPAGSGKKRGEPLVMDNAKEPRLAVVLCFDQGLVKEFKWCPMPRDTRKVKSLGLLAVINSDGALRVLDVELPKATDKETPEYRHITKAPFGSCPPNTVCTCVAWMSPSMVAAGCANGYVAVWDLSAHFLDDGDDDDSVSVDADADSSARTDAPPRPILYECFHMTFIREIVSCQPSRPNLLITSAMDGFARLTDVRAPHMDAVQSQRSRSGHRGLAWHEQTQHVLATDETYAVKALNVRLFYRNTVLCSLDASPLAVAASPLHPVVLLGQADGTVDIFNPVRRLLGSKRSNVAGDFVQAWFKHEWRPGRPQLDASRDGGQGQRADGVGAVEESPPLDFPGGLVRLTAARNPAGLPIAANAARRGNSGVMATVHEEQTGVRSLAWNPNLACGGWAAAGMGSGLVLIEDLAVDE